MRAIPKASTSHSEYFALVDSTTGLAKTGIAFGSVTASYARQRSARVAITTVSLAAATTAFTSGGWFELDSTNMPGIYRFDVPDAAFATGSDQVVVSLVATGAKSEAKEFRLTDVNDQDPIRFGLTALPNAAAGATNGLDCTITVGGTASAGSATTITLTGGSATDNLYNHQVVQITAGTGAGQARIIIGYVGSTKVATVSRAWTTSPDSTSVFQVKGFELTPTWQLVAGVLSAATGTTATLTGAVATDSYYNGALLVITAGTGQRQARVITGYVGSTTVATVDRAWTTTPDSTSVFVVYGADLPKLDGSLQTTAGSVQGNVTGAVASVTAAVTVGTNNDKTGYGLANNAVDAAQFTQAAADKVWTSATRTLTALSLSLAQSVWDVLASSVSAASSIGLQLKTNVDAAISSRLAPTVGGRTLDVAATGEAGLDFDNVHDATGAHTLTNITVPLVTTTTTAANLTTNNDKTGYALSAAGVQAVWDALTSALTTAGSVGKRLADNLDATVSGVPTAVWAAGTRTLSAFGFTVDILQSAADKVWTSTTRTLTALSLSLAQSVWDVLASSVAAASSIGLQIKTNLDATVGSRLATAGYTAPLSAPATANAVLDELVASHQTAGTVGAKLEELHGLLGKFSGLRNAAYSGSNLTNYSLFIYDSLAHAQANDGVTGVLHRYDVANTFDGSNNLLTSATVRVS